MTLRDLAQDGQVDAIEERWLELVEAPGPVEDPVAALRLLVKDGWTDRAADLSLMLVEPLVAAGRHADALATLRPIAGYAAEADKIREHLLTTLREVHAEDLWLETYLEVADLEGETPPGEALARFDHMCDHEPGRVVLNAAGWGLGTIESRGPTGRLMVRFKDGSLRPFDPHQFEERLKLLAVDDFRALRLIDPEGLKVRIKEKPGEIVKSILAAHHGSATSLEIRDELLQGVLTKSQWTTFWKSAREAVTRDPLIALNGPPTRPRLVLRERPVTLGEEAAAVLAAARTDSEAARCVADYVGRGLEGEERSALLDQLASRLIPEASRRGVQAAIGGLAVLLVLEGNGFATEHRPETFLAEACEDESAPGRGLIALVTGTDDVSLQNDLIRLAARAWPEDVADRLAGIYPELPRSAHDTACTVAIESGGAESMAALFAEMLKLPSRHSEPLLALTRSWVHGRLEVEGSPPTREVLKAVIPILAGLSRGTGERLKLFKAWHHIATAKRSSLLDRFIREATEDESRIALSSVDMHADLPDDVAAWLRGGIRERFPHLVQHVDIPFWEQPFLYCTAKGITRRKEELRVLVDEKIPENAKAIGRAASFGDLSENAEWQAAIEERGILSQRAEELRGEVDKARPLERAPIPRGIVSPGCSVKLRKADGSERELMLLGPWDTGDERIISYQSPLAMALLGAKVDEDVTVELPTETVTWTVLSVEIVV